MYTSKGVKFSTLLCAQVSWNGLLVVHIVGLIMRFLKLEVFLYDFLVCVKVFLDNLDLGDQKYAKKWKCSKSRSKLFDKCQIVDLIILIPMMLESPQSDTICESYCVLKFLANNLKVDL